MTTKIERRIKIKYRVRNKISGTTARPRMTVFRSNKQIYVQLVDDLSGRTLAAASSLGMEAMPKKEQAAKVGELIAKKAQEAGITTVVFDRNGAICITGELRKWQMLLVTVDLNFKDHGS